MKVKFNPTDGLILIPTRLHGPKGDMIVRLALDTGATGSMISCDIAVLLGYDPVSVEERIRITTGSGIEFVPQINIKKIEILGRFKKNFPILCHTLPPSATIDGPLGLDFFRGTRFTIDLKLGTFTCG
jgi:hypothetical protein